MKYLHNAAISYYEHRIKLWTVHHSTWFVLYLLGAWKQWWIHEQVLITLFRKRTIHECYQQVTFVAFSAYESSVCAEHVIDATIFFQVIWVLPEKNFETTLKLNETRQIPVALSLSRRSSFAVVSYQKQNFDKECCAKIISWIILSYLQFWWVGAVLKTHIALVQWW